MSCICSILCNKNKRQYTVTKFVQPITVPPTPNSNNHKKPDEVPVTKEKDSSTNQTTKNDNDTKASTEIENVSTEINNVYQEIEPDSVNNSSTNSSTELTESPSDQDKQNSSTLMSSPSDTPKTSEVNPRRRSGITPIVMDVDEMHKTSLPVYPKEPEEEKLIQTAFEKNTFLNQILTGNRLKAVINAMYKKEVKEKETIIKEGEKGRHLYVSATGKFQVLIKGKVVKQIEPCEIFGELAILYNAKRLATIKAVTKGSVWVLDQICFQQLMVRTEMEEADEKLLFLQDVKEFSSVKKDALESVASLLKTEFFATDKVIIRQGDKGDKFYIIRAGSVTITTEADGFVGKFEKGHYFGEKALQQEDYRQATVTANAPGVECLTLTRQQYLDHFGDVEIPTIQVATNTEVLNEIHEYSNIDLNNLKIIKTLGIGGFGRVELVQHKTESSLVFALKYIKKIDIVAQGQQEHTYNEKMIQMSSNSPFIVRLYNTYKDNKYVYFLMESCLGGDLWSLLQKQKQKRFDEKSARFICGCVLSSFEYLHRKGIVYRDLKPENLLVDSNGYIKLTDFGFAKKITGRGKTYTFAGTPEYIAPEIVQNRGHDRAVDYWAFGIFVYELFCGRTPFRSNDPNHLKTYNNILSGIDNVQFPSHVPHKAKHMIEKLCRAVPNERLGMQRNGIKDIKNHRFFVGFDWVKLSNCEMSSPFKPNLKTTTDTRYFEQFNRDTDNPDDETSGWDDKF